MRKFFLMGLFLCGFFACIMDSPNPNNPETTTEKVVEPKAYQHYLLPDKPTENEDIPKFIEKADLGKVLFFTKINGSACSDCHSPAHGFTAGQQQSCGRGCEGTPPNRRLIEGFEKPDIPAVKSPSSIGIAGSNLLLWNGSAGPDDINNAFNSSDSTKNTWINRFKLHAAVLQAFFATSEGAHDMRTNVEMVRENHPEILDMFKKVYTGVAEGRLCEVEDFAECVAAFQMRLVPNDSRFQQWLRGEEDISTQAKRGLVAFEAKCASCHEPPFMGADRFADVGFPHLINELHDGSAGGNAGRYSFTKQPEDSLKFRIMRLATNVTAHIAWGHGGTFNTLEGCIKGHKNINAVSEQETDDIVEFLNMTGDSELLKMKPEN